MKTNDEYMDEIERKLDVLIELVALLIQCTAEERLWEPGEKSWEARQIIRGQRHD